MPGAADEAQRVHVGVGIDAVAVLAARRGRDQADALVVADHLGRDARGLGRLADVHAALRSAAAPGGAASAAAAPPQAASAPGAARCRARRRSRAPSPRPRAPATAGCRSRDRARPPRPGSAPRCSRRPRTGSAGCCASVACADARSASGTPPRSPDISTTSAASMATSVPVPMAMPTSACGERRRVVDAVADEGDPPAAAPAARRTAATLPPGSTSADHLVDAEPARRSPAPCGRCRR